MKNAKAALAIFAISALPLVAAAPAMAVIDRDAIALDCVIGNIGESDHALLPGESVTITLTNCDDDSRTIADYLDTGNATLDGVVLTNTPVEITSNNFTVIVEEYASLEVSGGLDLININLATVTDDPAGELLATEPATITANPDFFTTPEDSVLNEDGDPMLGGNDECDVAPGDHPYTTIDVTITTAGIYNFRVVDTDPVEEDMYYGIDSDLSPIGDNYLALFDNFNPDNVNTGIVGCNDDGDDNVDTFAGEMWAIATAAADERGQNDDNVGTSTGYILDDQFAWFSAELEPGEYTLVATTYGEYDVASWLSNLEDAEVDEASMTFEMWGPEGGLELGHVLADTGVEPTFALWTGLALAGTGVAITVARRRTQRD